MFFDALRRHSLNLGRRGCPRTALEFNKLLLSLSPTIDPACVLVNLDYYCLRAREYAYLLDFTFTFDPANFAPIPSRGPRTVAPRWLPNFSFSAALAKWHQEGYSFTLAAPADISVLNAKLQTFSASALLYRALMLFPEAIKPLLAKSNEQEAKKPAWAAVFAHSHFARGEERLRVLPYWGKIIQIFTERHGPVWRPEKVRVCVRKRVVACLRLRLLLGSCFAYLMSLWFSACALAVVARPSAYSPSRRTTSCTC